MGEVVYDLLFKLIVIGDSGTGKSCLLKRFLEGRCFAGGNHTIGVEFGSRIVDVGGKSVKLQIWDTAGQERFRSVTRSYYRGAMGALIVYDVCARPTYDSVVNWIDDARALASPDIVLLLVGNKVDAADGGGGGGGSREVPFLEGSQLAQVCQAAREASKPILRGVRMATMVDRPPRSSCWLCCGFCGSGGCSYSCGGGCGSSHCGCSGWWLARWRQ